MNPSTPNSGEIELKIAGLGCITVYQVSEDELNIIERGSPSSTYLNFAIGLISIGISFFVSLFSTEIKDIRVFNVFWIVAISTTVIGIVLLVVWYRSDKASTSVISRIKERGNVTPDEPVVHTPEDVQSSIALED